MSIPPAVPVPDLVDRLLKAAGGLATGDIAARLDVDASYVSQLRSGYRPQRMGAARRARLVALVEELEGGYDSARAAQQSRAQFYDGVLFAAQAMSETVTRLLSEARAGLRQDPITPTAGEVVVGMAALDAADEAGLTGHAPRRRKGQSRPA